MACMGIRTMLGAVTVRCAVTEREHYHLVCALLCARGVHDSVSHKAIFEGTLSLVTTHMAGASLPKWRESVGRTHADARNESVWRLQCPRCGLEHAERRRPLKLAKGWPKVRCNHCQEEPRAGQWRCQGCLQQVLNCDCPEGRKQPIASARAKRIMRLLAGNTMPPGEAPGQGVRPTLGGEDVPTAGGRRLGEVAAPLTSDPLGATLRSPGEPPLVGASATERGGCGARAARPADAGPTGR